MDRITQGTRIDEILGKYPSLSRIFVEFGLPCQICGETFWGTVEDLGRQHIANVNELVDKLNEIKRQIDAKS
jgi:hypothetical protein